MDELEQLRAQAAAASADCDALEAAIGRLGVPAAVPGLARRGPDGRVRLETFGVDVAGYPQDELGCAEARRDVLRARAAHLRWRWETLKVRADRRELARARAEAGVARFAPGSFSLDRIIATTASMPEALAELRAQRDRARDARTAAEKARVADVIAERVR